MTEPWFNPSSWAWLPGTFLGCLGGLWGALAGSLAPYGKAPRFILGSGVLLIVVSMGCLAGGLVALRHGQPYGVWYALLLPGVLGVCVLGPLFPLILLRYRQAETRKIAAKDL